ncbi:ATP-NAD kinase [Cryptosporidium felis]|nr:ATP-NAD kinase [Cryptosporidium felis]
MPGVDEFVHGDNTCRFSGTPQNILIVKRPKSPHATLLAVQLAASLTRIYGAVVYCEEEAIKEMKAIDSDLILSSTSRVRDDLGEVVDLAISLGGDGTLLWLSHLFQASVPPVVSVAMGSLGYMSLFHYSKAREIVDRIMRQRTFAVSLRSRLTLHIPREGGEVERTSCLNECVFERGNRHCLASIDVYCSGSYFTRVFADGLILATPSGSTAYSMSAGGSIVHPKVSGILFTPICPHTLSFRPVILPGSTELLIHVPESSRDGVQVALDGRRVAELRSGQFAAVTMSSYPLPLVICPQDSEAQDSLNSGSESKGLRKQIDSTLTLQDILEGIREAKTLSSLGTDDGFQSESQVFVCPCCRRSGDCLCGIDKEQPPSEATFCGNPKEDYWLNSLNHYLDWNSQRAAQIPVDLQESASSSIYSEFQSSLKGRSYLSNPKGPASTDKKVAPPAALRFLEGVRSVRKHDGESGHGYLPEPSSPVTCLDSKLRYSTPSRTEVFGDRQDSVPPKSPPEAMAAANRDADLYPRSWSQNSSHTDSTLRSTRSKTPFFTPVKIPGVIILERKVT